MKNPQSGRKEQWGSDHLSNQSLILEEVVGISQRKGTVKNIYI